MPKHVGGDFVHLLCAYSSEGVMKRNFGINFWKKKRYERTRKTY